MAKWRAIHADISTSGQVNRLTEFEQLLFTWMIPHADDWGILTGDPVELKLKVMPGTARQGQELTDALCHIEEVGLIWRYEPDGEGPLIQFRKWDDHQYIREDRRKPENREHTPYSEYQEMTGNAGQCQAKTAYSTVQDSIVQNNTPKGEKPKSLFHHWACQCYKHVAHNNIKIPLREGWISFAEEMYADGDEEARFDALKADLTAYMAKGWYEGNIDWFMKWVRKGKPEKWEGGKGGKDRRPTHAGQASDGLKEWADSQS